MRRAVARNSKGERRNLPFEKQAAKLGMDQLRHEAALKQARACRTWGPYGSHEVHRAVQRALKLAKKVAAAEKQLAIAKSQPIGPYEGAYFVAYERHMPLEVENEAYRVARRRMHKISEAELYAICRHPEVFPNPRLVYSFFDQTYRIDWDGKP